MSVKVEVNENDLAEMVEQVWMSYLDPAGVSPLIPTYDDNQASDVHSSVSITGSWTGHVVYASSTVAARRAAAAFLAMEMDEVSTEDLSDVLGELANIVGGNVKAMLPPGAFLSLPQVVLAPESATKYPNAERITGVYGIWEGEPVSVSMWQSRSDNKRGERMKILIADDSRVMRQIVVRTLRQAGFGDHDLVEAADGKEAFLG
jgi:chemotaxis protein CheX